MDKTICGIDVSKDRLDVAVRPSGERFVVARTGAGLDDLVGRLKVLRPDLVVLEATGGFETVVVAGLAGASLPVAVANPAQIRAFAKAIGQRAKTDPIDADVTVGADGPCEECIKCLRLSRISAAAMVPALGLRALNRRSC
jgi:transposase